MNGLLDKLNHKMSAAFLEMKKRKEIYLARAYARALEEGHDFKDLVFYEWPIQVASDDDTVYTFTVRQKCCLGFRDCPPSDFQ